VKMLKKKLLVITDKKRNNSVAKNVSIKQITLDSESPWSI
jgi:hypothetical protein